ncbi:MAG TPA: SusD/RagB family nutrient-binding outer membrane lipoprotein [Chitinophaga sp.]|uniref:SusD/RagB family nutrient-binding outer membrane lipoprotein n=1 Tax=Chitinophaga sp. TaxID=1869181 RepID=UPI002B925568|nr:SusD/RagB family nutrient-binding outer membrane lipoprotein [Chitinophaga sp.]HVI47950.1 SusD/RagB family nutrient-binding outer membrane lipoprotein [Chitinophaga sp.]
MKAVNKWGIGVAVAGLMLSSCTKDFENINKSPVITDDVPPELLITQPAKSIVDRDFDWFYDSYQYQMQWMQFGTSSPGSSPTGLFSPNSTNDFYNAFYKNIGRNLVEIENLVAKKSEDVRVQYNYAVAIAKIMKVYAGWRVSDANGSIPYSEAFKARTDNNFTPAYDNQESLFNTWNKELKDALTVLTTKQSATQISYGNNDIFYAGDATKWAMAGNVLRMKIAMRLLKRAPEKAGPIVKEVMASPAGLFKSNEDEWKFVSADQNFARAGNWAMSNSPLSASKNMLDYMVANKDPRLGLFYEKNSYSKELFDSLKAGGVLNSGAVYNDTRYVGLPSSPDKRTDAAYAGLFKEKNYTMVFNGKEVKRTVDSVSSLQLRLFYLDAEDGSRANNSYVQPILTYAEQCFMISELIVRGLVDGSAETWYNDGIKASVRAYDFMGQKAKIRDYAPLDEAALTAYLTTPAVVFTGGNDVLLEKINIQNFINHFKSPWEAWGAWKRTGIPKEGGILPYEQMKSSGNIAVIPRRWALPIPTIANQTNWRNAITEMQKTGEYGVDNDYTGRVWWDKK